MKSIRTLLCLSALVLGLAIAAQADPIGRSNVAPLAKKVNQFHFVVDNSGSMMMDSRSIQESKALLAKKVVGAINARLPLLDYDAGLYTVAPAKTVLASGAWDRMAFGKAAAALPTNLGVFGRLTNLGSGLSSLSGSFGGAANAVILVTDGWANIGPDTLAAVRSIANSGARFHVISFADTKPGMAVVKGIQGVDGNSVMADGEALLLDPVALDSFVKAVFYDEVAPIVVDSVYFATGSYELDSAARSTLDTLALHILNVPRGVRSVEIEGFADITGNAVRNAILSENRTLAVRDYLVSRGVSADIIYVEGNGVSFEFPNETVDGRAHNRRVTLILN